MSGPAIEFDAVARRLGGRRVLDGLSLTVNERECVALVGGNGAGKTTTLKVLLDFQHADAGTVRIFGISQSADPGTPASHLPARALRPSAIT